MLRRAFWALAVVVALALPSVVRAQGDYLDVYRVKVKPEKYGEFRALTKKWVEANKKYNGDRWLAAEVVYGEGEVVQFVSLRKDYAEIDKANEAVMAAVGKAFGADAEKTMQDFENCLVWSKSELRRRRADLSRKVPADQAAYAKYIGESRYIRTTAVHVRPGHILEFEGILKDLKAAAEKDPNTSPVFVSQVVEGSKGTTFYISTLRHSMAGFDKNPTARDILGEEGYKKFLHGSGEAVEGTESAMYRYSPELSNPSDDVAAASPDFWHPKAAEKAK